MTSESRHRPLLENSSLKHVSATTYKLAETKALIRNEHTFLRKCGFAGVFRVNGINKSFRGYEQTTDVFHGYR
jgi:hypothetical protein